MSSVYMGNQGMLNVTPEYGSLKDDHTGKRYMTDVNVWWSGMSTQGITFEQWALVSLVQGMLASEDMETHPTELVRRAKLIIQEMKNNG